MRVRCELKKKAVGAIGEDDKKMIGAIKQITAAGNHAEVRRKSDGSYTIYEVRKSIKQ